MSDVTNTILALDPCERVTLEQVNAFDGFHGKLGFVNCDHAKQGEPRWYGGSKNLECVIAIGAFNHLNLDRLIAHLRTFDFSDPRSVQLIVQEQDDFKFRIIDIFPESN